MCVYIYIHTHTHTHRYIYICGDWPNYIYIYIYMYVCMYVCTCTHTLYNWPTDTHTHTTRTHTHTLTDTVSRRSDAASVANTALKLSVWIQRTLCIIETQCQKKPSKQQLKWPRIHQTGCLRLSKVSCFFHQTCHAMINKFPTWFCLLTSGWARAGNIRQRWMRKLVESCKLGGLSLNVIQSGSSHVIGADGRNARRGTQLSSEGLRFLCGLAIQPLLSVSRGLRHPFSPACSQRKWAQKIRLPEAPKRSIFPVGCKSTGLLESQVQAQATLERKKKAKKLDFPRPPPP